MKPAILCCLFTASLLAAPRQETVHLTGLHQPVEILRDRWGVPHIYAQNTPDLFFAQGYITAMDRLFQIDLWRRVGTGKLAEVLGPSALRRDRIARLVRYRGDWNAEWRSYAPDAREIAVAFTAGINAYIHSLNGKRPIEFEIAGYDPGLWAPEDVAARVAGLLMSHNFTTEVSRSIDVRKFGAAAIERISPPDPFIHLTPPRGLELAWITAEIARDYTAAIGAVHFRGEQGSNNWVVDGSMTATGKPLLASDPHRPVQVPSLRKTVHLVAPGWDAFGAGEPALPGIALGHNESIAFGFTIVGIDQQDLYVERLNPSNADEYRYRGAWRKMEIERQQIAVKGSAPQTVELRYTLHGPVLYEDRAKGLAYALRWVGSEPGGAGYLPALSVARAHNWSEFQKSLERYEIPSENIIYADTAGNIGWVAAGWAPVRKNWSGLFPVPGENGDYEWSGYLRLDQHPQLYNPSRHFVATANQNILPPGYKEQLSFEWAQPFRFLRAEEMLKGGGKYDVAAFERMQQDVTSVPARRFQAILRNWQPADGRAKQIVRDLLNWDARMTVDSREALIYEFWTAHLPKAVYGEELGARTPHLGAMLRELEQHPNPAALETSLHAALADLDERFGSRPWRWGSVHHLTLRHPLDNPKFNLPPVERPGDGNTVNATSGANYQQASGASYREVIDLADWDRSMMTNTPGESGDPHSPHYSDLLQDWAAGRYHPMPFSRKAVEAAAEERIVLTP